MSVEGGDAVAGVSQISSEVAAEDAAKAEQTQRDIDESLNVTEAMAKEADAPPEPMSSEERFFDAPKLAEMLTSGEGVSAEALEYTSAVLQERLGMSDDEAKGLIYALQSGVNAQSTLTENQVFEKVGGRSEFDSLKSWAETALGAEDKAEYNRLAESASTPQEYKAAVDFLHQKREERHGVQPEREMGQTPPSPAIKPIRSRAELVRLMSDERYASEPSFREAVDRRLDEGVRTGVYDILNR